MSRSNSPTPTHIIFFFPYRGIGGVSILFLRLASAIKSQRPDLKVSLIDYPDGYMAKNLTDPSIDLIPLIQGLKIELGDDAILVVQSLPLWRIPKELSFSPNCRLLMWHLHPMNLVPGNRIEIRTTTTNFERLKFALRSFIYFSQARQFRQLLLLANNLQGIVFMDTENFETAQRVNKVAIDNPIFIPIPSTDASATKSSTSQSSIRCAWIGRLEDFKIPILIHTMERVSGYSAGTKKYLQFSVVGIGEGLNAIQNRARKLETENQFIKFIFAGQVAHNMLETYLLERVDILFAMGTSALEGAKVGIPTVLLDFSYKPILLKYKFRLIQESEGYTLGRLIRPDMLSECDDSIDKIFEAIDRDGQAIGDAARSYFKKNHSITVVQKKLQTAIDNCNFTIAFAKKKSFLTLDVGLRCYFGAKKALTGWEYKVSSSGKATSK